MGAFLNCRKLKSPLLPKSLREIGPRAFAKCWNIRQRWRVHKENPWIRAEGALLLTANGREVLHCRPWAKGEILVPEGVERIRRGAFFACVRVTNVLFPPGLRAIEEVAFADCGSLRKICLPEGLEELGRCAFADCVSLRQANIPLFISKIPEGAFSGCISLDQVSLPDTLTEIGEGAFYECDFQPFA